jgi:photosystem II stability/assembly factor-like uncharacterized protein
VIFRSAVLAAGFWLAGSSLRAGVDPGLFQDLHWRSIGPFRGGRVLAVSGVPGEPDHFYFGAVNGGVWETRDAGRTWQPIFDDQPIGSIGALAVAPSDPKVLYVGTGEADMRSDIAHGGGVYRSGDGGRSWKHVGLCDSFQIGRVLVHPADPNLVYVAALGHAYGPNDERGVFRSKDGGATWQKILGKDADTGAIDLAFRPGDPRVIYAALWQTRRPPWNVYPPSNGPGSGLYKSTDGGDTWRPLGGGGFAAAPGRIGLAVAPAAPDRVYAMVDAKDGGLYRSDDGGARWRRASADRRLWQRGWYFGGVTVDPRNPDVVYACNTAMYRSDDGGATFAPVKGAPGGDDYHELWIDPEHPERRALAVDQGALVSHNGGASWSSWYNQPTGQFYHVITDNRVPFWVYGAQQDSGAAGIPSRTGTHDGINLTQFHEATAGGENGYIAPDPKDPDVVYGGTVERLDLRTQQTRKVDPTLAYPGIYRSTWTLPLVFSRRDPRVLYFANQHLFRTADGGRTWARISPDLTRERPGVPPNLDPTTAATGEAKGPRRGVIYAIAPSRQRDGQIWAGTDDGLVWRTEDEGQHWQDVTPQELTAWSKVGVIEAGHFSADTAYAAIDRHRLDDDRPYVYRTHDGGRTWQLVVEGIAPDHFVNVVREDEVRPGLLYAGTEKGVYVSFDDGGHWQPLMTGLPVTSVRDLDVHGTDLVIATHGRGFYVMDDVTPLRQAGPDVERAAAWLYAPAPAVRLRPAGFTGTPFPKDEPRAPDPPAGAYLDYVLKTGASTATLTILDAVGARVRQFRSDDPPPKPDVAKLQIAPEWTVPPRPLAVSSGMHRFVWNLRYPAPPALARADATPSEGVVGDGVWAPPGRYTVELAVGGQVLRQPLTIEPDPRAGLPAVAYARQFALARRIEEARDRIETARGAAIRLHETLREREKDASEIAALDARVLETLGIARGQDPRATFGVPLRSVSDLRFLSAAFGELLAAVDGADAPPSPDAEAGFAAHTKTLETTLAAWEELKARDLAALNARLVAAGKAAILVSP